MLARHPRVDLPGGLGAGHVVPGRLALLLDVPRAPGPQLLDRAAQVPRVGDPHDLVDLREPGGCAGLQHGQHRLGRGGRLAQPVAVQLGQLGPGLEGVHLVHEPGQQVQALLAVGIGVAGDGRRRCGQTGSRPAAASRRTAGHDYGRCERHAGRGLPPPPRPGSRTSSPAWPPPGASERRTPGWPAAPRRPRSAGESCPAQASGSTPADRAGTAAGRRCAASRPGRYGLSRHLCLVKPHSSVTRLVMRHGVDQYSLISLSALGEQLVRLRVVDALDVPDRLVLLLAQRRVGQVAGYRGRTSSAGPAPRRTRDWPPRNRPRTGRYC